MVDQGRIRSTVRPDKIVVDDYSVWVNTDVQEVTVTHEGDTHTEYEYHQVQYTKDEYIKMMDSKNTALEKQIDDTQIALCEVYELIGG